MTGLRKYALLIIVLALAFFLALLPLTSPPPLSGRIKLTVVMPPFPDDYIATYALETGLLHSEELVLEFYHSLSFNEYLMALRADLGLMSTEAFAKAYEFKKPLRIVSTAIIQGNEKGNALLFVRRDSEVASPIELREKRIGLAAPRGLKSSNLIFLDVLEKRFNFSLSLDSNLIIDKPLPQLPDLLDRGEVDAVLVFGDVAARMDLERRKYRLICDVSQEFKKLYGHYPIVAVMVARTNLVEQYPSLVREALRLLNESLHYGLAHVDEALEWLSQRQAVDVDIAVVKECLRQYVKRYGLSEDDRRGVMKLFELAHSKGLISVLPNPEEAFASLEL